MSRPHPALFELATGRPLPEVRDFSELLRSAHEHRMTGLLWSRVEGRELDGPGDWTRRLAQIHLATRQHHQKLWTALESVTNRLNQEGIRVATFKGVTAEARWYDHGGERPSGDIDLWVAPRDLKRFGEIVRMLQPDHPLRDGIQDLVTRGYLQGADIDLGSDIWVDLHADLFKIGLPSKTAETMWDRTEAFPLPGGSTTQVLDPETSLVHFLLHLNVDRFSRLNRITDVLRVVERAVDLDWPYIDTLVKAEGLEVPAYLSLGAALDPFGVSVPVVAPSGLRPWIWRRLWSENSRLLGEAGARWRLRQRWMPFLASGRSLEALGWTAKRSFPPSEVLSYFYPDIRGPYLWRVFASRVRFQRDWHRRWAGDQRLADASEG